MPSQRTIVSGFCRSSGSGKWGPRGKRVLPATISTSKVDRHGTIILPDSTREDIGDYLANPVLLWCHDRTSLPIGRLVPGSIAWREDCVDADYEEAPTEEAAEVFDLYESGFLNGFSVAGYARSAVYDWSSRDERAKLPDFCKEALLSGEAWAVFTRFALTEVSACPVPSNPGALARALNSGQIPARFRSLLPTEERISALADRLESLLDRQEERRERRRQARMDAKALVPTNQVPISLVNLARSDQTLRDDIKKLFAR